MDNFRANALAFVVKRFVTMKEFEVVVIGAGIVGLATAHQLLANNPSLRICVLEKEAAVAMHQTGHNSGVIHSGIYYKPKSLKAENCKRGYDMLLQFAQENDIKHEICGKVIVATQASEMKALDNIFERGVANELHGIKKINAEQVREIEPYVQAIAGVFVPQTGIIDYVAVAKKYAERLLNAGATIVFEAKVKNIIEKSNHSIVEIENGEAISAAMVVNCAGLYSDKIAKMTSPDADVQIIPFRGEYYELRPEKSYLVRNLIYPVPNPDFPFLGVHYTRMINGGIEAGPNAVLAFQREGYSRWDLNGKELWETLTHRGFQKVMLRHWRDGLGEMVRSYSKAAFVRALQHLIPEVQADDLVRGGAGVRAQACDRAGNLLDDFHVIETERMIHVCNAPSPAATASLAIGETIAQKILQRN